MNATHKLLLGILSCFPLVAFGLYNAGLGARFIGPDAEPLSTIAAVLFAILAIGAIMLYAFYLAHVLKHPGLTALSRAAWLVFLLGLGPLTMPVYWFLHIYGDVRHPMHVVQQ